MSLNVFDSCKLEREFCWNFTKLDFFCRFFGRIFTESCRTLLKQILEPEFHFHITLFKQILKPEFAQLCDLTYLDAELV